MSFIVSRNLNCDTKLKGLQVNLQFAKKIACEQTVLRHFPSSITYTVFCVNESKNLLSFCFRLISVSD